MLEVYAGPIARQQIIEHGFTPDLFSTFTGASGGPKWFVLYGLDRFLFGEFFKNRQSVLNLVGSSAGAFRAACFAQRTPLPALDILTDRYINTVYPRFASPAEVTASVRLLLDDLFAGSAVTEVLENPLFKLHMIVAKCSGLVASENRLLQGIGLIDSSRSNRRSRSLLAKRFIRYVFQPADSQLVLEDPHRIPIVTQTLNTENLTEALLASGSLPLFMQGVKNPAGCAAGVYRDGGIIDYQFDLNFKTDGLILYPHYNASLKPGWFDKKLKRTASAANYERAVLLCPSTRFVDSLPYKKIPDRSDFNKMDDIQRISYWKQVVSRSQVLADELSTFLERRELGKLRDIDELLFS